MAALRAACSANRAAPAIHTSGTHDRTRVATGSAGVLGATTAAGAGWSRSASADSVGVAAMEAADSVGVIGSSRSAIAGAVIGRLK